MQNDIFQVFVGLLISTVVLLIVALAVWKPTTGQKKPFWNRIKQRLQHPLTKVFQYKTDIEIIRDSTANDWITMRSNRGFQNSGQLIREDDRDSNSMLH